MERKIGEGQQSQDFNFVPVNHEIGGDASGSVSHASGSSAEFDGTSARPERQDVSAALVRLAENELWRRRARTNYLPGKLFGEVAWQVLLHLFISHLRGDRSSLEGACQAAGVPDHTCLRWIKALQDEGLLQYSLAGGAHTASDITLTPKGYKDMRSALMEFKELG